MNFGHYIKTEREQRGWTQPEAAIKADIEQSYLSKLESGKRYPSEEVFEKLVKVYQINIGHLDHKIFAADLEKLRDISSIRSLLLGRHRRDHKLRRSWFALGLLMLMAGSSFAFFQLAQDPSVERTRIYESYGVIPKDADQKEYRRAFFHGTSKEIYARLDLDIVQAKDTRGDGFYTKVEGGTRYYNSAWSVRQESSNRNLFLLTLGSMLMVGGIACFVVGRHWR
ncbi:MAG: helix-turn-helix transcriptional regulator [Kordiimonadaceae bacterium]|nr:helix-turn-helix transcriptional regulator [Kordiimonadaceae bacterium]